MATDLQSTLEELTALPTSEHPFLSVYLDWTPDGNGDRLALRTLRDEFDRISEHVRERDGDLESLTADFDRINAYLEQEAPADARALAIFACHAQDVWHVLPLQVPVETQIVEAPYPHTFNLARIIDDYETYAVVLADSQESRILVISLNEAEQAATTDAGEQVKRFQAGGWAQMIFQRRTDNVIKAHTQDISDRLDRIIKRYDVKHVIVAGNDSIKGIVMGNLSDNIKEKLVDYINLDIEGNLQSILEVTEPMMREVEQQQEADVLTLLEGEVARNGLGFAGIANTALALTKGQVDTLIMHEQFMGVGGECPNCGTIRAGLRQKCPYDGAEMNQVNLREIFTARALQSGSQVQIVGASEYLDQNEGVGAILRYRDDQQAQVG